jgi:hypothetical protein
MALRLCPYCSGLGQRDGEERCGFCGGSGDLFGHMLERVYVMGREEALDAMRAIYADWLRAGRAARDTAPPAAQLRKRLGL